ncbi:MULTISPECIES: sigma-70 family RNA polymerase sigma factor [Cyanophyceae]|uniref:sigma-70 family RNA polymerase sigma factor n=1 Tax=Cyanophyceae TaxID=3028117 RepID=UPI001685FBE3|nr:MULTISPECIES: sigma-70 family RNA polymerase sigma factor [Cyanophyceae]MBD1916069.1 sigma-70 family RNA polymerase sigma factor [Phormidium sp. FACHB-77]MBD2031662.1 sigma-70 family RNA polymerase sigma factor [Phormidium sp. FACHB-322]MBD2052711.1 sigma-70 family RNA polymerase sigma factor [Leptolyngbya sp. FACHB-60]
MDFDRLTLPEAGVPTDADLWLALKSGQTNALGPVYDRHGGLVYGIALKVLGHTQEAEDLTQDIFVKLQSTAYDPQRGSLRTFLAILTRSRAIDRLRSRQVARAAVERLQSIQTMPLAHTPDEALVRTERAQDIQTALAELSESQQKILRLAYYEGLSQSTIAEQLDTPLGTVKTHSRRGLLRLRQILQERWGN